MSPLPGEPRESPKPQPIGSMTMMILLTTCTLCILFLLWKKADVLRRAVSHQLKTLKSDEGRIRLSGDDGPLANENEFLADDYDEDNEHLNGSEYEPLSEHIKKVSESWQRPIVPDHDNEDSSHHP